MIDKIENTLIVLGSVVGITNIDEIIGIILLVVQLILVLAKGITKIYKAIKQKNYGEIIEEVENLEDDLNDFIGIEREEE